MNTEEQRIAIAEACGWVMEPTEKWLHMGNPKKTHATGRWIGQLPTGIPDYPNDRNATYAAAQQLGERVIKAMRFHLFEICGQMHAHCASAAQECEAILKAIGKWKEPKASE